MSAETGDSDFRKTFKAALALFRAGRYEEALDGFNRCVDLSDKADMVYDARAATFEKLERNKEALKDARRVIELCPHSGKGYIRAGRLFLKLNRFDSALEMCTIALERVSDQDKLSELSALQADAKARRSAALSARACHIEKLPVELLTMVFLEWKAIDRAAPVYASHVNPRWRGIAHSTSKLWTRLVLGARRPERKAANWLKRSNGRLLEFVVRVGFAVSANSPIIDWLRNLLITASKTLVVLDLDVDSDMRRFIFEALCTQSELPLRSLILRSSRRSDHSVASFFIPRNFKCLETINISDYGLRGSLPCPQLRSLKLRPRLMLQGDAERYTTLLRNVPDLEELSLCLLQAGPFADVPIVGPVVPLPNLTVLELEGTAHWSDILKAIATPALRTFRIEMCYQPRVDDLLSLIIQHNAPLASLTIISCAFAEKRVATQLPQFPLLNRLEIMKTRDVSNFLVEALAESPAQWPNLEHVNFSACPSVSGGPLLRLVRNRLPPKDDVDVLEQSPLRPLPIKSLMVDGCEQVDMSVVQWMQSVVERVSCVYQTKEAASQRRRRDP